MGNEYGYTACNAYADGGILILPGGIGGDDCGATETDKVSWKIITADGADATLEDLKTGTCKLLIYGEGAMKSYRDVDTPWLGFSGLIDEIVIDEGVTSIGQYAFEDMTGYDLTVGSTVTSIGAWAFEGGAIGTFDLGKAAPASYGSAIWYQLTIEEFVVDADNPSYQAVNGVLLTKDGKTLIKASSAPGTTYVIPDGTEIIGGYSFYGLTFESVTFPSSYVGGVANPDPTDKYDYFLLPAPAGTINGYQFDGYYNNADFAETDAADDQNGDSNYRIYAAETAESGVTIYAKWVTEVTYDYQNGTKIVVGVPKGQSIKANEPDFTVDGKTLKNWSSTSDDVDAVVPTAAMTVYAVMESDDSAMPDNYVDTITDLQPIADYTYTGEAICPAVFYKDSNGNLKQVADSYVIYKNNINAGTATVKIMDSEASVNFTINKAKFNAAKYAFTGATQVEYDGQLHSLTVENLPEGVTVTYTYDGEVADGVRDVKTSYGSVSSYRVVAAFNLSDNYEFEKNLNSYKQKTGYLYINPIEVTITANDATMYVGESVPALTYTAEGLSDSVRLTTEPKLTTSASGNKAGNFPITATGAVVNEDTNNYKITYVDGLLTVGMKVYDANVSFADSTVTYDGKNHNIQIAVDGTLPNTVSVSYTVNGEPFTGAIDAGTYEVTAAFANTDPAYPAIESLTATLTIKPAPVTITADRKSMTQGEKLPQLTYTVNGLLGDDVLTTAPTVTCSASGNTVGEYDILVSGADAGSNYAITYVSGTLTVYEPYVAPPAYDISVTPCVNGSVKLNPPSASEGTVVTVDIKPSYGYELDTLTVTDASGNLISTKRKASDRCTFVMPSTGVSVTATFRAKVPVNPFTDVSSTDYYYNAVIWAVKNGVTTGATATTFRPDETCTRAQTVTFLWRAAGSPEPKTTYNPFTDLDATAYYYKAVLRAVENGITTGVTPTTFAPNDTVDRAQVVTFLHRMAKLPTVGIANPFTDIAAGAYYYDAVVWAVSNGVTTGATATTFAPNDDCTRGQIVTFLYRYFN